MERLIHLSEIFTTFAEQAHKSACTFAEYKDHPEWVSQRYDDLRGYEEAVTNLALWVATVERPAMLRKIDPELADNTLDIVNQSLQFFVQGYDQT